VGTTGIEPVTPTMSTQCVDGYYNKISRERAPNVRKCSRSDQGNLGHFLGESVPADSRRRSPRDSGESANGYHRLVAALNRKWRVIECCNGVQWILQYRRSAETCSTPRWQARSHCRTREALIRCCTRHAGPIDPAATAILAALPETITIADSSAAGAEVRDAGAT
jgi:hypothetical protein